MNELQQEIIQNAVDFHNHECNDSKDEKAWYQWTDKVESMLGHNLDGDQDINGYSLDYAYVAFVANMSPYDYASIVKNDKNYKPR